jgi:hypothetical protein
MDDFISELCTDLSRGIRINKNNLGERIEKYNEKYNEGLDQDAVLFWAFDGGLHTLAFQIYPFVIRDLKDEERREADEDTKRVIRSEINVFEYMYQDLKETYLRKN